MCSFCIFYAESLKKLPYCHIFTWKLQNGQMNKKTQEVPRLPCCDKSFTVIGCCKKQRVWSQFVKTNSGWNPKNKHLFPRFFKKMATQKTRFFRVCRNFGRWFLKKSLKSSIFGVPDLENCCWQAFDKKNSTHQNFWSGPSPSTF